MTPYYERDGYISPFLQKSSRCPHFVLDYTGVVSYYKSMEKLNSILTKNQKKVFSPVLFSEDGHDYKIVARVRFDDECGNGHNTFSITADIYERQTGAWRESSFGCQHDEVAKHFPQLAKYIKWHLVSTDGPMHYVENTLHFAGNREFATARNSAVWAEATDEQLSLGPADLKRLLEERLPALLAEFRRDIEELGFTWNEGELYT